jgi:hypothetical protein
MSGENSLRRFAEEKNAEFPRLRSGFRRAAQFSACPEQRSGVVERAAPSPQLRLRVSFASRNSHSDQDDRGA